MEFKQIEILNYLDFKEIGVFHYHPSYPDLCFKFDISTKNDIIIKEIISTCIEYGKQQIRDEIKKTLGV